MTEKPIQQALRLLSAAYPHLSVRDDLATLTMGQRDRLLMHLRESWFGSHVDCTIQCPQCQDDLELSFQLRDVWASVADPASGEYTLSPEGYEVTFRLPNSLDVIAAIEAGGDARQRIFEACILQAYKNQADCPAERLPTHVQAAVIDQMAEVDSQADVEFALTCPECGRQWETSFDIVTFLWSELHRWACRTLQDVHRLALAYGWSEANILGMSATRRQLYLEMLGS